MPHLINIAATGSFADNTTFARAMTSTNALLTAGSTLISLSSHDDDMRTADLITLEDRPISGIFLNIGDLDSDPIGTLTIVLCAGLFPSQYHTFTYYTSSLLQANYTSFTTGAVSNYWQGFDLQGFYIGPSSVRLSVICTVPGEVSLFAGGGNEYNRLIVPTNTTTPVSAFNNTIVNIGSYVQPTSSTTPTITSSITHNITGFGVDSINIFNGGRLEVVSPAIVKLSSGNHLVVAPGGELKVTSGTTIQLDGGSILKGLDQSTIIIEGTPKLSYSFLSAAASTGNTAFTATDVLDSWMVGDSILFTKNSSSSDTRDTEIITGIDTQRLSTTSVANSHIHINDNVFGPNFYGAPICNLTRDVNITTANQGAIVAEKSCSLNIINATLNGLGWGDGREWCIGAVNLFNDNTNIQSIVVNGMYGTRSTNIGMYINAASATNYILNNNVICNQPANGILIRNTTPNVRFNSSTIADNVITFTNVGIASQYNKNITIDSNIIVGNRSYGAAINTSNVTFITPAASNTITGFNNNVIFNNTDIGLNIYNSSGVVKNNISCSNKSAGIQYTSTDFNNKITLDGIYSYYNSSTGIYLGSSSLSGGVLECYNLNSNNNSNGIILSNITGVISGGVVTTNTNYGIRATDCFRSSLRFYSITANNHLHNFEFSYPSNSKNNFYPTYITNCNLGSLNDRTAIDLIGTNCERFTVENTALQSSAVDVGLTVTSDRLIEGSYIFNNCTFSSTMFDSISTKYQTEVFNETGFVSMYHSGNITDHRKFLAAGIISSDTSTFFNPSSPISEKVTPTSRYVPIRSSRKTVPIDNYSGDSPPTLQPEFLTVSVWVKKDSLWGSNSDPQLVLAACPALSVLQDTILDTHSTNTTSWVKLTTTTPAITATNSAAVAEFYITCSGNSGGSINIDNWEHTFI